MKKNKIVSILLSLIVFSTNFGVAKAENQFESIGTSLYGYVDGDIDKASFRNPSGMAYFGSKIYIADTENNLIRVYDIKSQKISTLSGNVGKLDKYGIPIGGYKDGDIKNALFNRPTGIAINKEGIIYIADSGNNVIRKIVGDKVFTLSGTGKASSKDGAKNMAEFNKPTDVAIIDEHTILVSDTLNNAIKTVDINGNVDTIADGKILSEPTGLANTPDGILILDSGNQRVLKLKNNELLSLTKPTTAIDSQTGYRLSALTDGSYDKTDFAFPKGIYEKDGVIYVADTWNNAVRILLNGKSKTLVSKRQLADNSSISLKRPYDVLVVDNILYISDSNNNSIVKITMK